MDTNMLGVSKAYAFDIITHMLYNSNVLFYIWCYASINLWPCNLKPEE